MSSEVLTIEISDTSLSQLSDLVKEIKNSFNDLIEPLKEIKDILAEAFKPDPLKDFIGTMADIGGAIEGIIVSADIKIQGKGKIAEKAKKLGAKAKSVKSDIRKAELAKLLFTLNETYSTLEKSKLDEKQMRVTFKKAKTMLKSGCLANRREIIERYVNQVIMNPQSIEVRFNLDKDFIINETLSKY